MLICQSFRRYALLACAVVALLVLSAISLRLGAGDFSYQQLLWGPDRAAAWQLLEVSRLPRTIALVLSGMGLAVAGMIMQMLVRNRFVEPSTAGTIESATLGILVMSLLAPDAPVLGKMGVATLFALLGTFGFLALIRRVPLRSPYVVPLVGLAFGGVIGAVTTFLALRFDLLQSLNAWTTGDFSGVLKGRYELLYSAAALVAIAWFAADRFTVAGLGEQFTTNLGLNYQRLTFIGLLIVATIAACVVVTVGNIPFLGLIVPNIVSMVMGDNMRRSLPWIALLGGLLVLACDIVGRLLYYPYEIPIGTVLGVVGAAIFLYLLIGKRTRFVRQ